MVIQFLYNTVYNIDAKNFTYSFLYFLKFKHECHHLLELLFISFLYIIVSIIYFLS